MGAVDRAGAPGLLLELRQRPEHLGAGRAAFGDEAEDILSTSSKTTSAGPYEYMAGTSQATPHVAGVAALLGIPGPTGPGGHPADPPARDAGFPWP